MTQTKFENEKTWFNAIESGQTEELHKKYDLAVKNTAKQFGLRYPLYIDGETIFSKGGESENRSPNDTRILLGIFQNATKEDVSKAGNAAQKAYKKWEKTSYNSRIEIIRQAADIIAERKFELAAWMSFENGKNRFESVGDVDETLDLMRYYCWLLKNNGGFDKPMNQSFPNEENRSILKPYGVWGVISPFNFPLAIAAGMSVGALITGNTVLFKPCRDTPILGYFLCKILHEAGLPKGVFNYLTGPGSTVGVEIIKNEYVKGVVFTGSKEVGFTAYNKFSTIEPRPFIAELGGKNPVIVTAKADIDKATEGIAKAAFGYSGQKCSAVSRVYVEKSVKKKFVDALISKTLEMRVGSAVERDSSLGPLINKSAYDNFQSYMKVAHKDGKVLTGGHVISENDKKYGYYVEPTIVDGLPKNHNLFKEELFVPIVCIAEVNSLDEALTLANNTEYGLTAGIFTQDKAEADKFLDEIEAGVTYVNRRIGATTGANPGAQSFVGWKMSGTSGIGAGGPYYLYQFLREQSQTRYP